MDLTWLRFGPTAQAAPWGEDIAIATAEAGYRIDRRALDGRLLAQVIVNVPRRVVTPAMRAAEIERELARINGPQMESMVDIDESRRIAREEPFADSLPPYVTLLAGPQGELWVTDYVTVSDSTTQVTQFGSDGAILARLTVPRIAFPVWFGADRVMLREVDEDGVVRFGVYRLVAAGGGGSGGT